MKRTGRLILTAYVACMFALTGCSLKTNSSSQIGLNGSANGSVAKSEHGLSLSLSLDATTYQPDQEISMVVDEENTLSSTNDVPSSQDYRLNTLTLSECGMEFYPFGVSIFQGQYTLLTLPKTMPLLLYDPYAIQHGCPVASSGHGYDFEPLSDIMVSVSSDNIVNYIPLKYELSVNGYWTKNNSYNSSFSNFKPGVYTVIAGDEWGAAVVLHFTILQ